MKQCYHVFVSGRVQGVFFRESTRQQAVAQGVSGWVRNRHDGRVEAFLCGEKRELESMLKWLETGPQYAKVADLDYKEVECNKSIIDTDNNSIATLFEVRVTV